MKHKISPEEYREILGKIRLDTLYLTDLTAKFAEEFVKINLKLDIKEKYSFKQEKNILKIFYNYSLNAKDEFENSALSIKAKYVVKYEIMDDIVVNKDFVKIFAELTISLLLWTYFRELVNNIIYRMGIPPLVLPLKRI